MPVGIRQACCTSAGPKRMKVDARRVTDWLSKSFAKHAMTSPTAGGDITNTMRDGNDGEGDTVVWFSVEVARVHGASDDNEAPIGMSLLEKMWNNR